MSIVSVIKAPPIWSPAFNPIIWMIDSDATTQFKFRYVFDVYIEGKSAPIRFKVPPNPAGKGLIDVATLAASEIDIPSSTPFLSSTPFESGAGLATRVYCLVGEEYASTPTGATVLYNGLGFVGEPAFGLYADSASPAPNATTPVVAYAAALSANEFFDYYATSGSSISEFTMSIGNTGAFLTSAPNPQTIRSDENFTLTWLNRAFSVGITAEAIPYAMVVELKLAGDSVGIQETIATTANGGPWPTCLTLPPLATGASGDEWLLESFKINPESITSVTRYQEQLFGFSLGNPNFGCLADPIPTVFPGYHDTGLTPAGNPSITLVPSGGYIEPQFSSNCGGIGVGYTGWSDLAFRNMQVKTGQTITIQIPSLNPFAGSFADMYLWGSVGASTNPAHWEQIGIFTVTNSGGNKLYSFTGVSAKNYKALGLRWNATTTVDCGSFGCFSNFWNITGAITPEEFDTICLTLYPWENQGTCAVGPTGMSETICLIKDDTNCWGFEPIRFTWLNPKGGRDWYTYIKRNTWTQSAQRETLFRLPKYWSSATYSNSDNSPARWGTTVFNIDLTNTWTASTDWITEEESLWLREMFASPSVFVYLPGRSQPTAITITDGEYSVQTYARQKLFQHFVSFVEAQPQNTQAY